MTFTETAFNGLLIIQPSIFEDSRGYFFESYNQARFEEAGVRFNWLQDNEAKSGYGVIRGLHFQAPPYAQTKLIRAVNGHIMDVVLDLRRDQPTYGKTYAIELSSANKLQLLVPAGFAHGYSVLSDSAEVLYKCDTLYNKASEAGISPLDASLQIDWKIPADKVILSEKDLLHPPFETMVSPF